MLNVINLVLHKFPNKKLKYRAISTYKSTNKNLTSNKEELQY